VGADEERFSDVELRGPRVTLRAFDTARDIDGIVAACSDPVTLLWLPIPMNYTEAMARSFCDEFGVGMLEAGTGILRAIELDGRLVGAIDAKRVDWRTRSAEVGYWSVPAERGEGLMTEALDVFARWLLADEGLERVELRIAPGNLASIAMSKRTGFTFEGVARNAGITHRGRVDLEVHSLVRHDLVDALD
jgi:RimJ/RimL family protein N-acetyltransferase